MHPHAKPNFRNLFWYPFKITLITALRTFPIFGKWFGKRLGMGYHNTNIMRKPYLSTSNYIKKMSNYKADGIWDKTWDAMFYKFLTDNKSKLKGGAAVYLRNLVYFEKKSKISNSNFLECTP